MPETNFSGAPWRYRCNFEGHSLLLRGLLLATPFIYFGKHGNLLPLGKYTVPLACSDFCEMMFTGGSYTSKLQDDTAYLQGDVQDCVLDLYGMMFSTLNGITLCSANCTVEADADVESCGIYPTNPMQDTQQTDG
jgi:hypothetical protein